MGSALRLFFFRPFEIRFFFEKLRENSINKNANPMDSLAGAEDFFSGRPGELCGFGGFPSFFFGALACCLRWGEVFSPKSGPRDGAGNRGTNAVLGSDGVLRFI